MEVLASTFVIGVGLLGVLAVIPFGAYQVSKARDAEHTANMLAAAAEDLLVFGIAKPATWREGNSVSSNDGIQVYSGTSNNQLNCRQILMVDPLDTTGDADFNHIYRIGANFTNVDLWRERMRGRDDLEYSTHESARTTFSGANNRALSSGKYTWFFTFRPKPVPGYSGNLNSVPYDNLDLVNVDLLGCYNRAPGAPGEERSVAVVDVVKYQRGVRLKIRSGNTRDLDISKIKYVFVTWATGLDSHDGVWCKIVNASDITSNGAHYERTVFLFDPNQQLSSANLSGARVLLVDGVLYHKRVDNVPLR